MEDRISTLEKLSSLTVTHRKEKGETVYEFLRWGQMVKSCFTYDKAKMYAEGIKLGREMQKEEDDENASSLDE